MNAECGIPHSIFIVIYRSIVSFHRVSPAKDRDGELTFRKNRHAKYAKPHENKKESSSLSPELS
jgi:hypothetical protein